MNRRTKIVVSALLGLACVFVCPLLALLFFFFFYFFFLKSVADGGQSELGCHHPHPVFASRRQTRLPLWVDFVVQIRRPSNLFADETTQISVWSNVEASLGIAAGSLMMIRPLLRF